MRCGNCTSTNVAIAAQGQVTLIRCLDCTNHTILCPECNGRLRDLPPKYKEQRCVSCNYTTSYVDEVEEQVPLFI